ncbi:PadR family transcriptional regulator [Cellulomonas hominis]|uniref:PadR family transcriptional regulator n=1 Tax=Cellulomonas hominis TaxID=156981 RepID=UPI001B972B54|nr:Transcriptional regulator YqjI [Cellulomonas hominis]
MAVFAHGQLRLYLLSLLEAGPRHGYELITALSDRFGGMYRPSAGTVYPRLARLEEEGLVERTESGRKTLYALTDRGRAEVESHRGDLADLEHELAVTVRDLAARVRADVAGSMAGMRADVAAAAQQARAAAVQQGRERRGATAAGADVPEQLDHAVRRAGASVRAAGADARAAGADARAAGADARREARARRSAVEAELVTFRAEVRALVRASEAQGGPSPLTVDTVRTVLASARAAIASTLR